MNIAIIGTRGIPNSYGGFEQFAEKISVRLVGLGHKVTVYNGHKHPYKEGRWQGVRIVHRKDPEHLLGSLGQFIYDLNCILHTRQEHYDIILQLGYTSSSIWGWLLPRSKSLIITNMDGLEWKRSKYSKAVQRFLLYAESLAVKYSDCLIADAVGIKDYLTKKYKRPATYIAYGADIIFQPDPAILAIYCLTANDYHMLIARLVPENNIEMILEGSLLQKKPKPFLVIGDHTTRYGEALKRKYSRHRHIRFISSIYNTEVLNSLRYYSALYFHGHSVGGTNPSLVEAMGSQALICAHDNIFNRAVLEHDGYYFSNAAEVFQLIRSINKGEETEKLTRNIHKVQAIYSWDYIVEGYLTQFNSALAGRSIAAKEIKVGTQRPGFTKVTKVVKGNKTHSQLSNGYQRSYTDQ